MQISSNLQQAKNFSICVLEKSDANDIKIFKHNFLSISILEIDAIVIKILAQNFLHFLFGGWYVCVNPKP